MESGEKMLEQEVFRQRYSNPQCLGRSNILYPEKSLCEQCPPIFFLLESFL